MYVPNTPSLSLLRNESPLPSVAWVLRGLAIYKKGHMSGIAAVWRPTRPVERVEIDAMLAGMPHRGIDGMAGWSEGGVGLGQAMLHTTPESTHEHFPLVRGHIAVVADIRLDNREALLLQLEDDLAALKLRGETVTDGALLLASYARWGPACVEHIVGAFAFAIWDSQLQQLVCARDHIGVRQLYFSYRTGQQYAFATEIPALLSIDEVSRELNEQCVVDALAGRFFDATATLYRDVHRLRPAHVTIVSASGVTQRQYWEPKVGSVPGGNVVEQFADLFEEAVRCRMRSAFPVGMELSGGLDSSSVSVGAARIAKKESKPLHTFTAAFDSESGANEMQYVESVLAKIGPSAIPHFFDPESHPFISLHEEIFARTGIDRVGGSHYYGYLSAREASRSGVRVLLTGFDGDTTVGHGWELFRELARAGDWRAIRSLADECVRRLARERDAYDGQWSFETSKGLVGRHAVPVLYQWAEEGAIYPLLKGIWGINSEFDISLRGITENMLRRMFSSYRRGREEIHAPAHWKVAREGTPSMLRTEFAEGLQRRIFEYESNKHREKSLLQTAAEGQIRKLQLSGMIGNLEKRDLYPAAWHVEGRHPFMDVRLIEFCLSLPANEKFRDGLTRSVLRRALRPLLPGLVASRAGKAHLGGTPVRGIDTEYEKTVAVAHNLGVVASFVDSQAVRSMLEHREVLDERETLWLENVVTLSLGFKSMERKLTSP